MNLQTLLNELNDYALTGSADVEISGLHFDSREIGPGNLFFACVGKDTDGHRYIDKAIENGAAAIVGQQTIPEVYATQRGANFRDGSNPPYIQVPDSREALALCAAAWHGHPGRQMTVIGVTGTDGKTTTVNLLQSIFAAAGKKTGMVSTVNALIGDRYQDTGLHVTTPGALEIQALLAQMRDAGTQVVILEATSHGLAQHRVSAAEFDVAVVTNITHEHLDYHGSWEQYCDDKARLFRMLNTAARKPGVPKVAVINADDASFPRLKSIEADVQVVYGLQNPADVTATNLAIDDGKRAFTVHSPRARFEIRSPLLESYNVYNILAAVSAALALDVPVEAILRGVVAMKGVVGRMERIDEGQDFTAIVDFAHTPNALQRALEALRPQTEGRLIVVFGSAGLRDVYKREMMGRVAGRLADITVITAEDPRTEDLDAIIAQSAAGCAAEGAREGDGPGRRFYRVPDRPEAIQLAVNLAAPGDIVVTCGKSHEQSMCFGAIEYPWNEHQALRAALLTRLGRPGEVRAPRLPTSKQGDPL
ncbi:MAG: UDP-N-acetylmuramoyl-L-alanyl-D-glutamate--2,6-diaminopimelate ligase [Anaerolineae bacterium]|nr:UDP-N-acetylmuramoyl-L-alanyl-D-glutamate--2,6-diaminopimelate ligase [Anaerolineae bacterium]